MVSPVTAQHRNPIREEFSAYLPLFRWIDQNFLHINLNRVKSPETFRMIFRFRAIARNLPHIFMLTGPTSPASALHQARPARTQVIQGDRVSFSYPPPAERMSESSPPYRSDAEHREAVAQARAAIEAAIATLKLNKIHITNGQAKDIKRIL